jgi:hypothetical protein
MNAPLVLGAKVRWVHDPAAFPAHWFIQRLPSPNSTFVRISDKSPREYPKCESFCVPVGSLEPWDQERPHRAHPLPAVDLNPIPAVAAPAPGHSFGLLQFKILAAENGLDSHDLERITEIWEGPAPNAPMRSMRIHNYIRNRVKQIHKQEVKNG